MGFLVPFSFVYCFSWWPWAMASSSVPTLFSLRCFPHLADVGLKEEVAEEHKVAEVHEWGPEDVLKVRVTLVMLHPVEDQVVNDTAHQHLSDLGQGDEHGKLPGNSETGCSQGIVRVHHGVHAIVHGHEPTTPGHHVLVGVPGVQEHSDVVIPVQEDQLLLPQDNEYCISWKTEKENDLQELLDHDIMITHIFPRRYTAWMHTWEWTGLG